MIERVIPVVVVLFPISEIALALLKRSRGGQVQSDDRGSMRLLWISILVGVAAAFAAQWVPAARLPLARPVAAVVALAVMLFGLAIRWTAIVTRGRLFTVDVAIHADHAVVDRGLYRLMRHPSYTGLLVAFFGFGFFFDSWLSMIGLLVPIMLGVHNRVAHEEATLRASLGSSYAAYCSRTKRFVPGLF